MKQFLPVFRVLSDNNISYVTVGGVAALLHGVPRLTGDIDIIVELVEQNCLKALNALAGLGFKPRIPVNIEDFASEEIRSSWINEKGMVVFSLQSPQLPLIAIDIFAEYPIPYELLYKNSKLIEIEECPIRIASVDDIIKLKTIAGREKDIEDINFLSRIK